METKPFAEGVEEFGVVQQDDGQIVAFWDVFFQERLHIPRGVDELSSGETAVRGLRQ